MSTDTHTLRSLHLQPNRPLLLANAWDVASARVVEAAGAAAIATTSAGIAWALGHPDGDAVPRDEAVAAIARIVAAVAVPVTADIEGGYAVDVAGVGRTVGAVLDAGAVGINLEDGALSPETAATRIRAARAAAGAGDGSLFINARTDVYLAGLVAPERAVDEVAERAHRYLDAGADGVFVPGVGDLETIARLVEVIDAPLNVMAGPGSPSVAELAAVGVARISLGSAVAQAAYAVAHRAAAELFGAGTSRASEDGLAYADLNALLAPTS